MANGERKPHFLSIWDIFLPKKNVFDEDKEDACIWLVS